MTDVRVLKQRCARYKGNVTRILTYLHSDEPKNANDAQVRLAKLSELWDKFEAIQNELVEARPEASDHVSCAKREPSGFTVKGSQRRGASGKRTMVARSTLADKRKSMAS